MLDRKRSAWFVALLLVFALVGAACSDDNKTTASSSSSSSQAPGANIDYKSLSGKLNGSGSTFQDAFNQKAITQFKSTAPNVAVNYTKSGSGAGKTDLQNKVVQFAGTDSLIKDADKAKYKGGTVLYFPTVGAPITVSYNLSGVDKLQLSGETLAGIFAGRHHDVERPEDRGRQLRRRRCRTRRSSSSTGPTARARRTTSPSSSRRSAASAWTLGSGDTVNWPASTQGAQKNSGVAVAHQEHTDGAIGYVDLADAVNADLTVRVDQEQRRQVRRADARRRQRRTRRCHGEGRPHLRPDQRQRATTPTRSRRRRGSSSTRSSPTRHRRTR